MQSERNEQPPQLPSEQKSVWQRAKELARRAFLGSTPQRPLLDRGRRLLLQAPVLAPTALGINRLLDQKSRPETETTQEHILEYGDLRLFLNSENIPVAYSYLNEEAGELQGRRVALDLEQQEQYRIARSFALESGVPAMTHRLYTAPSEMTTTWHTLFQKSSSDENPWITERPKDVLTDKECAAHGLHVLNTDRTSQPKVRVRESAFETGGILQPLKLLNENPGEYHQKKELSIVSIDASFLDADSMTALQRAVFSEDEWAILQRDTQTFKQAIAEVRTGKIDIIIDKINEKRLYLRTAKHLSLPEREQLLQLLMELQAQLQSTQHLSESACYVLWKGEVGEKLSDYVSKHLAKMPAFGRYFSDLHHSKIVITGGDSQLVLRPEYHLTYMPDGTLDISLRQFYFLSEVPYLPSIQKSYPNPGDFSLNTAATYKNNQYPYAGQDFLNALRHELMHAWLVDWLALLLNEGKIAEVQWFLELTRDIQDKHTLKYPSSNEFATDTLAMRTLEEAWEKYQEGEGDDTGYQICIELPPHPLYPDGGFVLAARQDPHSATL